MKKRYKKALSHLKSLLNNFRASFNVLLPFICLLLLRWAVFCALAASWLVGLERLTGILMAVSYSSAIAVPISAIAHFAKCFKAKSAESIESVVFRMLLPYVMLLALVAFHFRLTISSLDCAVMYEPTVQIAFKGIDSKDASLSYKGRTEPT